MVLLAFVLIYPLIDSSDPFEMIGMRFENPGSQTFSGKVLYLGSDNFGRDALLELVHGTRTSLKVGLIGGITSTLIGLVIGLCAGFIGGMVDNFLTALTNMFLVIPSFVILILISVSLHSRSEVMTAVIIGLTGWPNISRAVRGQTVSLRRREHVNIARITGHSTLRIICTEVLPYIASYVFMAFTMQVAYSILQEASLSMLGLGAFNTMSLGTMMNWALMFTAPSMGAWWAFVPCALVISAITFSLYMINSGMDEFFNPKIRS